MSDGFPIHLVLCTHGSAPLLRRTLQSLAAVRRPPNLECIWVIENGSDAGARQVCQDMKDAFGEVPLRYVHRPQQGKALALQDAMQRIGHGLAVFLDDDTRFNAEFLEAYAAAAQRFGKQALYGGELLIDYEAEPPPAWLLPELPASARGWRWDNPEQPVTEPLFLGANYAAFCETILAAGGFKPHLGVGSGGNPVGEETELQERLLTRGCRGVYVPDAKVWHYVPAERCTPRWALNRARRFFVTRGLTETIDHSGGRCAGVPRWMWRRRALLGLKALAAYLLPSPARRYAAQKEYYLWSGYIEGVRRRLANLPNVPNHKSQTPRP